MLRDGKVVQSGRPVIFIVSQTVPLWLNFWQVNRVDGVVANKKVSTPLGDFNAPDGLQNGYKASVIIRHEALFIDPGNDGVIADVMNRGCWGGIINSSIGTNWTQ